MPCASCSGIVSLRIRSMPRSGQYCSVRTQHKQPAACVKGCWWRYAGLLKTKWTPSTPFSSLDILPYIRKTCDGCLSCCLLGLGYILRFLEEVHELGSNLQIYVLGLVAGRDQEHGPDPGSFVGVCTKVYSRPWWRLWLPRSPMSHVLGVVQ